MFWNPDNYRDLVDAAKNGAVYSTELDGIDEVVPAIRGAAAMGECCGATLLACRCVVSLNTYIIFESEVSSAVALWHGREMPKLYGPKQTTDTGIHPDQI